MRFVLIDRLLELEPGKRVLAAKVFSGEEDFFEDHFPGFPVVPGSLIAEAMGQAGGWLLAATLEFSRWPLLNMIDKAKFRRFVAPRQELLIEATIQSARESDFELKGEARVQGDRVADARLCFHAFAPAVLPADSEVFVNWTRKTFGRLGGEQALRETAARNS